MRRITLGLFFLLAACSSNTVVTPATDAAADVGTPIKDAGKDATGTDATAPTDADVPDVVIPADAIALTCQSASDCGDGGAPICCATLVTGAGSPPNCPIVSLTSSCTTTCTTSIKLACAHISTVRACAQKSDCTESGYANCCTFDDGNNNTATFCASDGLVIAAQSCK
jgi:hypothetical protein